MWTSLLALILAGSIFTATEMAPGGVVLDGDDTLAVQADFDTSSGFWIADGWRYEYGDGYASTATPTGLTWLTSHSAAPPLQFRGSVVEPDSMTLDYPGAEFIYVESVDNPSPWVDWFRWDATDHKREELAISDDGSPVAFPVPAGHVWVRAWVVYAGPRNETHWIETRAE